MNHAGLPTIGGCEKVHLVDGFGPYVTVATSMLDNRQEEHRVCIHQNLDVLVYIGRAQELQKLLTDNPGNPRKGRESPRFTTAEEPCLEPSEL